MANPEHLEILEQGVEEWNEWRDECFWIEPDLSGAYFGDKHLGGADFSRADLSHTDLSGAHCSGANFNGAKIIGANLNSADFASASFNFATAYRTLFVGLDLREVKALENVRHWGPSEVSTSTLSRSGGMLPETFLRGCGLSDWQIESAKLYQPELSNEEITNILYHIHDLRAQQAIQISPLFISYNHTDDPFVDKVEELLNERGVRFWRDVHHATAGRLERQVDRAIRLNPTVLLILSEHSVRSDWVQHEARLARDLEIETKRDVLCPIALDDRWKDCDWPARLREQIMEYNILDFSGWKDEDIFRRMFTRLLDGLDLFYK